MLKKIGILIGALSLIILIFFITIKMSLSGKFSKIYEIPESKVLVDTSEESIQNGKRLSLARGCADCHGENMGGKKVIDAPPAGVLFGSNLTRGKGGIGNELTDESIIKAIHNGVGRNGKALKWMPSEEYTGLSAEELSNLVAYIKSVPPVDNQTTPSGYGFITSILLWKGDIKLAAEVIDHSKIPTKGIVPEITKEYGEYLANTCKGCHGPGFSGGAIPGVPPDFPEAANITSDTENGIGKYKEEDFITAMTKGKRPDGSEINPFMPYKNFSNMTEVELKALWVYVKDIPPKKEKSR